MEAIRDILGLSIGQFTLGKLLWAAAVLALCLAGTKIVLRLLNRALARTGLERTLHTFVRSAVKVLLLFLTVVLVLGVLDIPVTSLVALFSVAGVAISLAIQGALTNLTSGIQLLSTHPFKAGDFVELGGVSGTVTAVGLVHSTLTTPDNKVIFVPNSTVTANTIVNYSANETRRIDLRIGASYAAPTETVKAALLRAAQQVDCVTEPEPPFAAIDSFGDSAIVYLLRLWVRAEAYWPSYYALNERVRAAFAQDGIEIPFGQLDVRLVPDKPDKP